MLDILKEIVQSGITDQWPGDGDDLLYLVRALGYFRQKALWAAARTLDEIGNWHQVSVALLTRYVPEDLLLNTAAELYHNAFKENNRLLVVLGSALGQAALGIPRYFMETDSFITRVVGLRYEERHKEAEALKPGMPLHLVQEPGNTHDPNAIAVVAPWGSRLGYLRATLAAILIRRCSAGGVFSARVAALLGPEFDPNYIEVKSEQGEDKTSTLICDSQKED